jgi:hypothetical protein
MFESTLATKPRIIMSSIPTLYNVDCMGTDQIAACSPSNRPPVSGQSGSRPTMPDQLLPSFYLLKLAATPHATTNLTRPHPSPPRTSLRSIEHTSTMAGGSTSNGARHKATYVAAPSLARTLSSGINGHPSQLAPQRPPASQEPCKKPCR